VTNLQSQALALEVRFLKLALNSPIIPFVQLLKSNQKKLSVIFKKLSQLNLLLHLELLLMLTASLTLRKPSLTQLRYKKV